jgi:plastocyanin
MHRHITGWSRSHQGSRRSLALAGGGLALAGLLTWALAGTALAAQQSVQISGFAFAPSTLTVAVGDTITWTNKDMVGHTATAAGVFDTGVIASGTTASVTLMKAGTFTYHCKIHPFMTGTIVVAAAATTPRPTTSTQGVAAASPGATVPPLPATDATVPPTRSNGNEWLILLAAIGAGVGVLLVPVRRHGRRRRG